MRLTELWNRMNDYFGPAYARSVAADHRIPQLASTVDEAIEHGVANAEIWRAVCTEFDIPPARR